MSWFARHVFGQRDDGLFKRPEENLLMLEQYLTDLGSRFISVCDPGSRTVSQPLTGSLAEVEKIIGQFQAYRASKSSGTPAPIPDWNEAFLAEQLLARHLPFDETRAELVRQLTVLRSVDATAHAELLAEWENVKSDATKAEVRAPGLLVSALKATQWKNTQRWIIRRLGLLYAGRLRGAFLLSLVIGLLLILVELTIGFGLRTAALSGLGFAVAAGLLGSSFSAMVGQGRVVKLDNIEEARAATSRQMIALRLGVGTAAATIIYFFFEAGLVEGALFPDLAELGFGRVSPLGTEVDGLRAKAQTLDQSAEELLVRLTMVLEGLNAAVALIEQGSEVAGTQAGIAAATFDPAAEQTAEKTVEDLATSITALQEALAGPLGGAVTELQEVNTAFTGLKEDWAVANRPLGNLAPNSDLSKLFVWSFAAGFAQTLVPSLLAKVAPSEPVKET